MIKEVIFDIDGTLYDYERGNAEGVARMTAYAKKELGIGPEEFMAEYKRLYEEAKKKLGTDNATIHSRTIRLQNMMENWGKPIFPHVEKLYHLYWGGLLEASEAEPGSIEAVRALRDMGVHIGIGTDMTVTMQYKKLERLGFAPYVDHIVTSQEAGHEKPHPEFMALCIEKAGCSPEELVFVGDTFKKDVAGPGAAGMHPVWYRAKERPLPENPSLQPGEYKVIRHFDELVPYIKELG
ncbi:HAD family hydrolase [Candidatus Merdisoma sp. HCP28S3_D10]|uniref:HAD family hydrolase n=1 Tax=unclassified Candidatus Merdisoma TaxID=3099611 RepID=UPI003F8BE09F